MGKKQHILSIVGFLGNKDPQTGKYQIPVPILKSAYQYIVDQGMKELKIKELTTITATEELGTGKLAAKLGSQYNALVKVLPIDWKASEDKSECARLRNINVLDGTTKIILLKKGNTFGGQALIDAIASKNGVDVLVYDIDTDSGSICKSQDIGDVVKSSSKGTPKVVDYQGISRHILENGFLSLDTETTQLGAEAEVVQLSFVEPNTDICLFNTLLKPKGKMSESASEVNKITDEMLQNAPTFEEVFPVIDSLIRGHGIFCYNSPFDFQQIKQEYERIGKVMPVLRFEDAMPLVSSFIGEKVKLTIACEKLGIKPGEHSAISDCISLNAVVRLMAQEKK